MRKMMATIVLLFATTWVFAENPHCKQVGGTASTNFLDQQDTLGTATGDLKGAIGVTVQTVTPEANGVLVFHNQHHWVTESGGTIFLKDADATAVASDPQTLLTINYRKGVQVVGGTGPFAGATGTLNFWGAADMVRGAIVLRYDGEICLKQ
jgi:hypothetical protein